MGEPLGIEVKAVRKLFAARKGSLEALSCIDLCVRHEEFVSVLGPSGCGKSTLLRIIGGLIPPTDGELFVYGQQVNGPQDDVGIAFQSPVLLPWRTVSRNIELQGEVRKLDPEVYRPRCRELLKMAGLDGFGDSYPYQLSGGMQQRVSLCRALVHDPQLMLMDEPFAALDLLTREQMMIELQRIWMEDRKTVLFITHSIPEAVFLSDRVVVMSARPGRIIDTLEINLPRPRTTSTMDTEEFVHTVAHARSLLATAMQG